jgi:hypothetical protein
MTLDEFFNIVDNLPIDAEGCKIWWPNPWYVNIYLPKGRKRRAHRLVLERELGHPIKSGHEACHTCHNKACVSFMHLYEDTPKNHRIFDSSCGMSGGFSKKLDRLQVSEIRNLLNNSDYTQRQIAKMFNVSQTLIWMIKTNRHYVWAG